jgi:hypothetical protein
VLPPISVWRIDVPQGTIVAVFYSDGNAEEES